MVIKESSDVYLSVTKFEILSKTIIGDLKVMIIDDNEQSSLELEDVMLFDLKGQKDDALADSDEMRYMYKLVSGVYVVELRLTMRK